MRALIYPIEGAVPQVRDVPVSLDSLRALVGGDIEMVHSGRHSWVFNENGKALRLERNDEATRAINEDLAAEGRALHWYDHLVGVVVVFGPVDDEGELTDYPD